MYLGYWKDRLPHGAGTMHIPKTGAMYTGIFKEGKFIEGEVVELTSPKILQRYQGFYHKKEQLKFDKEGQFEWYQYPGGRAEPLKVQWHKGMVLLNILNGPGTRYYQNGDKFIGTWKNNVKSGYGKLFTFEMGDEQPKFEGNFENDKRHG